MSHLNELLGTLSPNEVTFDEVVLLDNSFRGDSPEKVALSYLVMGARRENLSLKFRAEKVEAFHSFERRIRDSADFITFYRRVETTKKKKDGTVDRRCKRIFDNVVYSSTTGGLSFHVLHHVSNGMIKFIFGANALAVGVNTQNIAISDFR